MSERLFHYSGPTARSIVGIEHVPTFPSHTYETRRCYAAFLEQRCCSCEQLITPLSIWSEQWVHFPQKHSTERLSGLWTHCMLSSRQSFASTHSSARYPRPINVPRISADLRESAKARGTFQRLSKTFTLFGTQTETILDPARWENRAPLLKLSAIASSQTSLKEYKTTEASVALDCYQLSKASRLGGTDKRDNRLFQRIVSPQLPDGLHNGPVPDAPARLLRDSLSGCRHPRRYPGKNLALADPCRVHNLPQAKNISLKHWIHVLLTRENLLLVWDLAWICGGFFALQEPGVTASMS